MAEAVGVALLGWYDWLAGYQIAASIAEGGMQAITAQGSILVYGLYAVAARAAFDIANSARVAAQSLAINAQREISRLSVMIGFERRIQELTLQKALANQDVLIGEQQVLLANDRVRITEQEGVIEQLKANPIRILEHSDRSS